MEKFRIRLTYGDMQPLIEFCGDHRAPGFPDVPRILAAALVATRQNILPSAAETMIANDRYASHWAYAGGTYEIDDDVWTCVVRVPDGGAQVLADIEHALTRSGRFVRSFT
jgi:hypothetical protein